MNRTRPVVAIDGPAGAGKSTVARRLADRLGFTLVDTGALYRTVALAARRADVSWEKEGEVGALAQALAADGAIVFERDASGSVKVLLRGDDVSTAIREADMSMGASRVSAIAEVRDALLDMQRLAGKDGGVVLEGRDIGTVIFPDAEAKFFLTASPEVRAARRYDELKARGQDVTFAATLDDVKKRDQKDTLRPIAPLKQAHDAMLIDSSTASIDEVVEQMVARVTSRIRL